MSDAALPRRAGVAAITFHPRGGGIAALSRLVADALARETGQAPYLVSLATDPRGGTFATTTLERARFGARVAAAQVFGRCEWLLFTHLSAAVVQRAIPRWSQRPYAVYLHDVEAWAPQPAARARVLRGAFVRLANSEYTAARVAEANPDAGPIVACPLAIGPEWETAPVAPAGAPHERRTVVIVGRMISTERYKGHDQLLEAWPRVTPLVRGARLVCAGEGDDVPRLRAKAASLGVGASVDFPGFVTDAQRRALYAGASVFAMPSRREGFGLVYLEAMAAGVPCIGSIHDAASSVIVHGETGMLVDQGDRDALVAALTTLLVDDERGRALGAAGRRRFLAEFTLAAFSRRLSAAVSGAATRSAQTPVRTLRPTNP